MAYGHGGFQEGRGSRRQLLEVRAFEPALRSVGWNWQVPGKGQHCRQRNEQEGRQRHDAVEAHG